MPSIMFPLQTKGTPIVDSTRLACTQGQDFAHVATHAELLRQPIWLFSTSAVWVCWKRRCSTAFPILLFHRDSTVSHQVLISTRLAALAQTPPCPTGWSNHVNHVMWLNRMTPATPHRCMPQRSVQRNTEAQTLHHHNSKATLQAITEECVNHPTSEADDPPTKGTPHNRGLSHSSEATGGHLTHAVFKLRLFDRYRRFAASVQWRHGRS